MYIILSTRGAGETENVKNFKLHTIFMQLKDDPAYKSTSLHYFPFPGRCLHKT
jgi:hypothetical protein